METEAVVSSATTWREDVRRLFTVDLRSLAALRIGLGVVLLLDIFVRLQDLRAHYTDQGVLPREALRELASAGPSLHALTGSVAGAIVLFGLQALFALGLTLGFLTRLCSVLSWLWLISLHNRNPAILNAGDAWLRCTLFWCLFLPLGSRWSVDSRRDGDQGQRPGGALSAATVAILLQAAFVYWFAAVHKTGDPWRSDGSAVYVALKGGQFTTGVGQWLLGFPEVLRWLTYGVLWYEFVGPLLLFSPVWTDLLRAATVAGFWGLQLGFGLCMDLGLFPAVATVAIFPFVPGSVWDRLGRSRLGERLAPWGRTGDALLARLARMVPRGRPGNPPAALRARPLLTNGLVAVLLVYVLWANVRRSPGFPSVTTPEPIQWIGRLIHLDQRWGMFAPVPLRWGGWFVMPGRLASGREVDVWNGGRPLDWQRPASPARTYVREHWRKALNALAGPRSEPRREYFSRYLCTSWNSRARPPEDRLASVQIVLMRQRVLDDLSLSPPEKLVLHDWVCAQPGTEARR